MEALRIVEKPVNHMLTIKLPDSFGDGPVEVIVFQNEIERKSCHNFIARDFFGIAKMKMTEDEINLGCRKLREEWDRDF